MQFLSCLHSAINRSVLFSQINLKAKQVKCLEAVFNRKDTVAVLPTGYGKSLIYQLLPSLLYETNLKERRQSETAEAYVSQNKPADVWPAPVILVISPLNSLVEDQLRKLNENTGVKAAILKNTQEECDFQPGIKEALFDIVFLHPEACLSAKAGLNLLQSQQYQESVGSIVVDEAHCILEW